MKITNNSSTGTTAIMANYTRSTPKPSSIKKTSVVQQENTDYLQQVSSKNKHTQGLLRQLKDLLTQAMQDPNQTMFEESIEQNISKLYKTYPQYATRLKNKELSVQELIGELGKIAGEIQEESKDYQARISYQLVSKQNTQANKKQDTSKITQALVSQKTVNIIETSASKTNNLLK